jgi:hypothetical protein
VAGYGNRQEQARGKQKTKPGQMTASALRFLSFVDAILSAPKYPHAVIAVPCAFPPPAPTT